MSAFIGGVMGIALSILALNLLAGKRKDRQRKMYFPPPASPPEEGHEKETETRERNHGVTV